MASLQKLLGVAILFLGVAGLVYAQAPVKMGTHLPSTGGAPRLAVLPGADGKWGGGGNICNQCLAGGPDAPRVCMLMKCMRLSPEYVKIFVPPTAKEMLAKSCGVNRLCVLDNFEVLKDWPPKPGEPGPYEKVFSYNQITKPYKGFLELSRIDADKQLKAGALSKSDYDLIIKDYRSDWKSMQSNMRQ